MYQRYAAIRDKRGLTDYAVARASGVQAATLSQWKHGVYVPTVKTLCKLATALEVSVADLIGDGDEA